MNSFFNKSKKIIAGICLILIIFSGVFLLKPKRAYALASGSVVEELSRSTQKGVAVVPGTDLIFYIAAKAVLAALTQSIVNWINSGFEGNPIFVQNPQQFLNNAANQTGGVFIQHLGLTQLCSPNWFPRLKFALQYNVPYLQQMQCTPEMAATNVENFTNNFMNGGWDSWLSMTAYPQNNIWGAYFESSNELARRQTAAATQGQTEASWGQGFLSLKQCAEGKNVNDACSDICDNSLENYDSKEECMTECKENTDTTQACELSGGQMQNTTPGNIIANQLTSALNKPTEGLNMVNDVNQALAAIFNALINQLMQSGLSSLGGRSGTSNYNAALNNYYAQSVSQQDKNRMIASIESGLSAEYAYQQAKQDSLDLYNFAICKLQNLLSCQNIVDPSVVASIQNQINDLTNKKAPIENDLNNSTLLISQARNDENKIQNAVSYGDATSASQDFSQNIAPILHTAQDAINARAEREAVKSQVSSIVNNIDSQIQQCLNQFNADHPGQTPPVQNQCVQPGVL